MVEKIFESQLPKAFNSPDAESKIGQSIRILIVDEHPISRDGLRALLETNPGFKVVGEAADCETAIQLIRDLKPDILLLDRTLSQQGGTQFLHAVGASHPTVRTLLLSVFVDKKEILGALQLGAHGVIAQNSTTSMLFEGIRAVKDGHYWLGNEGIASLVEAVCDSSIPPKSVTPRKTFGLTPRELEIVGAVASGYSNYDIAASFSLSEHTVKHHIGHIFDKLGVSNRLELALFAVNHRLTDDEIAA